MKHLLGIAVILLQIILSESTYLCPIRSSEPVRAYGSKCYQFVVHRQITWNEARENCHREGGRLATVENIGVQAFLYNSLRKIGYGGEGVWIGLTDGGHEGKFTWDSGEPVTFQYWASGQPGIGASLEDCVLFKMSDGEHGHWHDFQCSDILFLHEDHAYICEFHMIQITTPRPKTTTTTTPVMMTTHTQKPSTTTTTTPIPTTTTTTTPIPTTTTPKPTTTTTTPMPTTTTTTPKPTTTTPMPTTTISTPMPTTTTSTPMPTTTEGTTVSTTTEEKVLIG